MEEQMAFIIQEVTSAVTHASSSRPSDAADSTGKLQLVAAVEDVRR